jgi:hypothetical protein
LRQAWRIGGVLLLTMGVTVLSSTPALAFVCAHANPVGHPAGCHRHGPMNRQPANHLCCAAGRDVAIPVSEFSGLQLSSLHPYRLREIAHASGAARRLFPFTESSSPPLANLLFSPLRI